MAEDGYVLLRGLVAPDDLASANREFAQVLTRNDWADVDGGGHLVPLPRGADAARSLAGSRAVQRELLACEPLHRLAHHSALMAVLGELLEVNEVLRHPRPVARVVFPVSANDVLPTPPHQDHVGMQGALATYTAWIAVENCDADSGAIAVAAGSHLGGVRPYHLVPGGRVFSCDASDLADSWRSTDFAPGDVVIFHSLAVHAALPNRSARLRRSLDCRYQRAHEPICEVSVREEGDLPWDALYRGWEGSDLVRYWERFPLNVVPFDPSYNRVER